MENKRPSIYEECLQKGISRRDFLKFCTTVAALIGLESSGVAQVVKALESDNLYNEAYDYAFRQLLRLNIDADTQLNRCFDFSIVQKKSLEHIHPVSYTHLTLPTIA
mgnify:CR=1 FL=1